MSPRAHGLGVASVACGLLLCILPALAWYSADLPTGRDSLTGYGARATTGSRGTHGSGWAHAYVKACQDLFAIKHLIREVKNQFRSWTPASEMAQTENANIVRYTSVT